MSLPTIAIINFSSLDDQEVQRAIRAVNRITSAAMNSAAQPPPPNPIASCNAASLGSMTTLVSTIHMANTIVSHNLLLT